MQHNAGMEEDLSPKPATEFTKARNDGAVVNFDDATDFDFARRGLVATHDSMVIGRDTGVAWDGRKHDYLRDGTPAPDTVHPGLWRQGQLTAIHGLFEVGDGVWQARGYDVSNITFIDTADGWLIIDPLTTEPTAQACLEENKNDHDQMDVWVRIERTKIKRSTAERFEIALYN